MGEDGLIIRPRFRHGVGAVLAEPYSVAVAGHIEHEPAVLQFPLKAGGTQSQSGPHGTALHRNAAYLHGFHAACAVPDGIFQPRFLIPRQICRRDPGQQLFPDGFRRKIHPAVVIGNPG